MIVNIVMATFNRIEFTKQTIPNLIQTTSNNIPYMITIVDNGSIDGTREYLLELFNSKKIHNLILLKNNIGVAKAQNLGWKLFEEIKYYGKIDNDVIFKKTNWLDDIIQVLENAPELGALGYNCEAKNTYGIVDNGKVKYRFKGGNIGGACHFIPPHVKEKLGFWNEEFDLYGEEDADYGSRIIYGGFKNAYMLDETVMEHLPEELSEYVLFKRRQRENNLKDRWNKILKGYQEGKLLKKETNIHNTVSYEYFSHIKEKI